MKKNYVTLLFTLCSFILGYSQNDAINYQGVARDGSGEVIAEENIALTLALKYGSASGTTTYSESHAVTTDEAGVFAVQIGTGTVISGAYKDLRWGEESIFLTTFLNGTEIGTTELLAVPYALASTKATDMDLSDLKDITGTPTSGQVLSYDGTNWTPAAVPSSSLWSENGNSIYRNTGTVGIGTASPESEFDLHIAGDVFVQSSAGGFSIGYPNNGHRWKFSTTGSGKDLLMRSKIDGELSYTSRFYFMQEGKLGIKGSPETSLHIHQGGQSLGLGIRLEDGINDPWDITHGYALRFHYNEELKSYIRANDGAYIQPSMRELKENLEPLVSVLSKVEKLHPTSYNYKNDKTHSRAIGLVVEEAEQLFPELVAESKADKVKGINYAGFSVIALKAIQEQQAIIKKLEERIEHLESKLQ